MNAHTKLHAGKRPSPHMVVNEKLTTMEGETIPPTLGARVFFAAFFIGLALTARAGMWLSLARNRNAPPQG